MNPFDILGIERDADATTIKRAYARAVKAHRPDVDAEGFQRVTDAYHACLSWDQWSGDDTYEENGIETNGQAIVDADEATETEPVDSDSDAAFELYDSGAANPGLQPFLDQLTAHALAGSPSALETWLRELDTFYPLGAKAAAVDSVIGYLENLDSPLAPDVLQVVLVFFAIDHLDATQPWRNSRVARLRRAALDAREFETRIASLHRSDQTFFDRMMLRELIGPRSRWRTIFLALVPGMPSRIAALHAELAEAGGETARNGFDRETAALWLRATDMHRLDPIRLAIVGARLASIYLIAYGLNWQMTRPSPLFAEKTALLLACLWAAKALFGLAAGAWRRHERLSWIEPETVITVLIGIAFLVVGTLDTVARSTLLTVGGYLTLSMISRFGTESFRAAALVHLLLSMALGACLGIMLGIANVGRTIAFGLSFGLLAMAALDEGYAHRHGMSAAVVRNGRSWLYAAVWVEAVLLVAAITAAIRLS